MSRKRVPAEAPEELSFESALDQLEALVGRLEDGEQGLEDSLRTFEEGVRLVRLCSERLAAAELRIQQIEETPDGPLARDVEIPDQGSSR